MNLSPTTITVFIIFWTTLPHLKLDPSLLPALHHGSLPLSDNLAKGRQLEHLCNKTGLTVHKEMHHSHILHYKDCITQAKSTHYSGLMNSNEGNSKALFSLLSNITQPPDSLPPQMYSTAFCNTLLSYFTAKIDNIHQQLAPSSSLNPSSLFPSVSLPLSLSAFALPSVIEISELKNPNRQPAN